MQTLHAMNLTRIKNAMEYLCAGNEREADLAKEGNEDPIKSRFNDVFLILNEPRKL